MTEKGVVSVVIPTYNAAVYIDQCVQNLLNQSYKQIEVIIVDDGSTDNTAAIAAKYPVKLIHQHNQGVSVARNSGLKAACGEFLHFMDVDDLIDLDFYLRMVQTANMYKSDIVCCNVVHERLPALTTDFTKRLMLVNVDEKMHFTNVIHQGQVYKYLLRKSLLDKLGISFLPELKNAQDKVFSMQAVYAANHIVICPEALYYYRHRAGSNMTSDTKEKRRLRKSYIALANKHCIEFAKKNHLSITGMPLYKSRKVKILGVPLLNKRIYQSGKVKIKILGITVYESSN